MKSLLHLLNKGLDEDTIPVVRSRRLRLGNSTAHDATVKPLQYVRLGDALSPRSSTMPSHRRYGRR